jgi:hypothetical protein
MLPPVYNTLRASSPVLALVGDRIYRHGSAPQGVKHPYLTWYMINGSPENTLSELPGIDRQSIQVDVWCGGATGDRQCEAVAEAVRDALEPHAHMTSTPIDQREQATGLWRIALEFDWFVSRPIAA